MWRSACRRSRPGGLLWRCPRIYFRFTTHLPQVDLKSTSGRLGSQPRRHKVSFLGYSKRDVAKWCIQSLAKGKIHWVFKTSPNPALQRRIATQLATSRLSCVSIETCADEVDFQVDLRLTWGRPEANVLNVLVNTTSWLEVDLRLTWGRPPGLHRRH